MTDTSHSRSADSEARYGNAQTAWAGWVVFGGVMLIMLGAFQIVEGLVALFDDGFYLVGQNGLVVDVDYNPWGCVHPLIRVVGETGLVVDVAYNTWGWVHTLIGVVGVGAGLGLLAGNMAARVVGVVIACLS